MHIKGRLLDQAVILFNCVPFQNGTSLKGKNVLPQGANSFLYEQFLMVWKITFTTLGALPCLLLHCIFIAHMRNCVMGATPMVHLLINLLMAESELFGKIPYTDHLALIG